MADKDTKTMKEWETELQVMFVDYSPSKKLTQEEAEAMIKDGRAIGVDHEFRVKWLKEAGHEVTRKNMLDLTLPGKIK